ncbi:hypothetical protein [Epinotia aporema granulovirus]|uniref:Uncharacterized protein n=1 Tax=Epinotia aporema granulovirus TaxID=166056 RepID=K4ER54_9BBAC|nr:hypothetical protein [Epinotia aporema granulovirus]AER41449.1 hypothetical protein [Epinotia aporema granulovirus]
MLPQKEDVYIAAGFRSVNVRNFIGQRHRIMFRIIGKEIYIHRSFLWMVQPQRRPKGVHGYIGHKQMVEQVNRIRAKHYYTYDKYKNYRRLAWQFWYYVKHRVLLYIYNNRYTDRPRVNSVWNMCKNMVLNYHKSQMSDLCFDNFFDSDKTINYFNKNPNRLRKLYQIFAYRDESSKDQKILRECMYFLKSVNPDKYY